MARTVRTKVYKFSELSEQAKEKVIDSFYYVNVEYDWYDSVYSDAAEIGLKITGFDIDYCEGEFTMSGSEVADKIISNHGEVCETYKTAKEFLNDWSKLVEKYSDGVKLHQVAEDKEWDFDQESDELEEEFKKSLLEDYRIILTKEYEYLTSREAIIETIACNDFEFTREGKQFY
jgi:hypothetical protein